jgi:SAM-dependent methyltransferase
MATADQLKQKQQGQWDAAAEGWAAWTDWYGRNFRPLTDWLCRHVELTPGMRLLDVACGTGEPALAAAAGVRPGGTVVAIDLSSRMLAVAARRAAAVELDNVTLREMDAEHLRFDDGAFDAVTCACGLMFCPDPARAMAEIHRVLRPNGRFAVAVWDEPQKNPFFTTIAQVFARFFPVPPPDPAAPGGFRLAPPGALDAAVRAGGFLEYAIESVPFQIECDSPAEYQRIFVSFSAALRDKVSALPASERVRLDASVREAAAPHVEAGRVRLTATALCACGRR